ncbi:MAG: hypothetical protein KAT34_10090 [Candidatus Aminicenantes bacterium]|nr:hypothetical protein [Candidatus Aminicenantes bacterium]
MKQKKQNLTIYCLVFFILLVTNSGFAKKKNVSNTDEKLFSGFSLKLGANKWIGSIGFDLGLKPWLALGLEFQPYFRSFKSETDPVFKTSEITGNIFLNLKAGYPVGKLIKSNTLRFLKPLKLYGGIGAGTKISNFTVTMSGDSINDFNLRFAWHMIFGAEYPLSKISIILEYQPVKVINKDLEPSTVKSNYWMIGIRF